MKRGGIMYKNLKYLVLMCCCLLFIAAPAFASEAWLYSIDGLKDPHAVAVAPNGNILVTFPVWDSVKLLDSKGKLLQTFSVKHPTALAAGPAGNIYIGLGKYSSPVPPYVTLGEVRIYTSSFQYAGSLGSGAGEFVNPSAIAVGADNRIYVADSETNNIKIYNPDGSFSLSFGRYGIGDTYLNKPQALAIDNTTGNIYVADKQLVLNTSGSGYVGGARIQVFGPNGTYIKGFGSYGELISPSGLAYRNGNTYVADSYLDLIKVYDSNGTFQFSFSSPGNTIRVPGSTALSGDGLLFVTGNNSSNVNIFGIDQYVYFDVTPNVLNFEAYAGGALPATQGVSINNSGTEALQWSASGSDAWLVINNPSGTLNPGASGVVVAGINQGGLPVGVYNGKINILNQNGTTATVDVNLTVKQPPVLTVTPSNLSFSAVAGSTGIMSAQLNIALANAPADSYWQAGSDAAWLGVNPVQAGALSADATVTVSASALAAGTYTGHVSVQSQGAVGSPSTVTVELTVINSGSIAVLPNIQEAAFTITGNNNQVYSGSGKDWKKSNVPDGTYKIVYKAVPGFKTPLDDTQTIAGGNGIVFTATYKDLRAGKKLIVSIGNKLTTGKIGIFEANGQLITSFMPFGNSYRGDLNIASGDIDGDGIDEIIVGAGNVTGSARVAVFRSDGTKLPNADFVALNTLNGAKVAAGDLDGDGVAEIIVGSGPGKANNGLVRVFKYINGAIVDTGVYARLFTTKYGVNLAAGDVDGDGIDELIVAPGPDPKASAVARILKIDVSGGIGSWKAVDTGVEIQAFTAAYGANVAAGDLNGDGTAEIIISSGTTSGANQGSKNRLTAFYGNGSPFGIDISFTTTGGIEVASGDVDMDGNAEIVTALGSISTNPSVIRIYKGGNQAYEFTAFKNTTYGAKIALGQLN